MNTSWRKFQNSVKNIPAVQVWEILATRGPKKNFLRLALIKCFTKKEHLQEHLPIYMIFCAIWYQLYNLKYVRNTHGGVLLSVKLQTFSNASQWNLQAFLVKFDVSLSKKRSIKKKRFCRLNCRNHFYSNSHLKGKQCEGKLRENR